MTDVDAVCPTPMDRQLVDLGEEGRGRFSTGDLVRVRATPTHETPNPRTPDYTVGKVGQVVAVHGVIVNPQDHHEPYPPMYSLRFDARELFGGDANHTLIAEVHEEFLDPA